MHIPDGFLSPTVWLALDAVAAPTVGYVARRAQKELDESAIPLLGVLGAFVFAAQLVNFPVGAGTSGHLVGSALLVYTLGPWAAAVVMTAILATQALVFQDGGILALGANVTNMALVGVLAAWLPFGLAGGGRRGRGLLFGGAFLSVMASGAMALGELLVSRIPVTAPVLWLTMALFAANALIEGLITVTVVGAVERIQPGWIQARPSATKRGALLAVGVAAVVLAAVGIVVASAAPDGLEQMLVRLGIESREFRMLATPLADYEWKPGGAEWLRKAGAGLAGLVLIWGACLALGRLIARRRSA
jgi:cobalt/nickel transport system permease protein